MFAADQIIDTIQNGKKYVVTTFVTDEGVRSSLHAYVDTQTEFVKQVVKTGNDIFSYFTESLIKKVK